MTLSPAKAISRVGIILEMIKFEHTVFALPFALTSALVAANGIPKLSVIGWILVAMVGARSSAMAFNRIADYQLDKLNRRTAGRALPTGVLKLGEVWAFTIVSAAVFVFAAWELNFLAFALSPIVLVVLLGYSYTKRFTNLSHLVLGLALGIAPSGAWIAVKGTLAFAPMVLSAVVIFWTAGFDVIYALQDIEFDTKLGLFSLPKTLGPSKALLASRAFHALTVGLLIWYGLLLHLGLVYYVGTGFVTLLLAYEQSLVKPDDFSKVNTAFFTINGFVSVGFFLFTAADLLIRGRLL